MNVNSFIISMKIKIEKPPKLMIGRFIKKLRKKFFLTQDEVCKKIGVSRPTYNKIESDKAAITLEQAKLLADFFNVGLVDLLAAQDTANDNIRSALSDVTTKSELKLDTSLAINRLASCIHYIWFHLLGNPEFTESYVHKLIFLIEYTSFINEGKGLFNLSFLKKMHSPIIKKYELAINDLLVNGKLEVVVSDNFKFPNLKYLPLRKIDLQNFSANELIIIEQIISTYTYGGNCGVDELLNKIEPLLKTEEESEIKLYPHCNV